MSPTTEASLNRIKRFQLIGEEMNLRTRIAALEREREELLRDIDDLAEHDPFNFLRTRIAALEREREELLRDIDDLAEHDPFKETNPEGNDYRTGYEDGLRWCAKHLRRTEAPP